MLTFFIIVHLATGNVFTSRFINELCEEAPKFHVLIAVDLLSTGTIIPDWYVRSGKCAQGSGFHLEEKAKGKK